MEIISADQGLAFHRFIEFPYGKYRHDPFWVPPLRVHETARFDRDSHPFYGHAEIATFIAVRDSTVVGRIAAVDDRLHNETHSDNLASFGYFEAVDAETAAALLERVESWARERGRSALRGPMNPSLHDSAGLLVNGFDESPMLMMPYNPPEYATFIEAAGFRKVKDLYAWIFDLARPMNAKVARLAERARARRNFVVRSASADDLEAELQRFRIIYTRAWEKNWGFVPPTVKEFQHLASELRQIADLDLVLCVEVEGQPAACAVFLPDVNQALRGTDGRLWPKGWWRLLTRRRLIDQGRLLLLGVLPEHRHLGLYPVLLEELWRRCASRYRRVEFSWVLEDNDDINLPAAAADAVHYKTYRLYQKSLA